MHNLGGGKDDLSVADGKKGKEKKGKREKEKREKCENRHHHEIAIW